jgi:bacteriorhodopsin
MNENFAIDAPKEKEEKKKNPVQYYVKFSFAISYVLLLTTGTITFIEALRTQIPQVRHVMNLETCISLVAGYFYSVFVQKIEEFSKTDKPIDWKDISSTRYIDWAITTPMMLLALSVVLARNIHVSVKADVMGSIILLNYAMLFIGYQGESGALTQFTACVLGFIPFVMMFYIIYIKFVKPKYVKANSILFTVVVSIWTLYGFVYMLDEEYKNISMNILDTIAKCFVGLGLWVYYTKIVTTSP